MTNVHWFRGIGWLLVVVGMAIGAGSIRPAPPATRSVTATELNEVPVMGWLGVPLGTCVEIRAVVTAGHTLKTKGDEGHYLLAVHEISGRQVREVTVIDFGMPGFVRVDLAPDDFSLYELKHGAKATQLTGDDVAELEKGYVGKEVRLLVYETGAFEGIPKHLPPDAPIWQDRGWGFNTRLVVLAERK